MSKLVFIMNSTEFASVDGDSLSHIKYESTDRVGLYFDISQAGAKTTLKVVLTMKADRSREGVAALTALIAGRGMLLFNNSSLFTGEYSYDGVERTQAKSYPTDFVQSVHSITYTEGTIAQGPQGDTGPQGPQGNPGANGSDGADGADGSDALALAGADQTLTGDRLINTNGSNFTIKDGLIELFHYDDSSTTLSLSELTSVKRKTSPGELRFKETPTNGSNYIALQAPASLSASDTFVLPSSDGSAGEVIKTDGSGNLSFVSPNDKSVLTVLSGRFQHTTTLDNNQIIAGSVYGPSYSFWSINTGNTPSSGGTVNTTTNSVSRSNFHYGAIRVPRAGKIRVDALLRPVDSTDDINLDYYLHLWELPSTVGTGPGGETGTLRVKIDYTSPGSNGYAVLLNGTSTVDISAGAFVMVTLSMDNETLSTTAYQYATITLTLES